MRKIIHQAQPCSISCISACLAMILGKDVNEVIPEFHQKYIKNKLQPHEYLELHNVPSIAGFTRDRNLEYGYVHLLIVPSLNMVAKNHGILLDLRDSCTLYDPNEGKEDKKRYVIHRNRLAGELEVELGGYSIQLSISEEDFENIP